MSERSETKRVPLSKRIDIFDPQNQGADLLAGDCDTGAEAELRSTFEDSGVGLALDNVDHQIIYGRRGAGKARALRYK